MIFRSTPAALRVKSVVGEPPLGQCFSSPEFPAALRVKSVVGEPSLGHEDFIPIISRRPAGQECGWGAIARATLSIPRISRRPAGQERGWGAIARAISIIPFILKNKFHILFTWCNIMCDGRAITF